MSDEPKKRMRTGAVIIVVLLALYVLGAGPAYRWGFTGDPVAAHWTDRVYWPLARLSRHRIPGTVLAMYVNLWSPPCPLEWIKDEGLSYRLDP
jgi:hypothetical protein